MALPTITVIKMYLLSFAGHISMDMEMRNVTKYEGETVRIRCEISGNPMPRYSWYKNDILVDTFEGDVDSGRINYRPTPWGSRSATVMHVFNPTNHNSLCSNFIIITRLAY